MSQFHHFELLSTPDGPMPVYLATPEGDGKHPAVLVIQGMHGAESFEMHVAERFADQGYVAAVPDLFHRGPHCFTPAELNTRRRALTDAQKTSDVNATIDYLQGLSCVQSDQKMGILGFCMGGRMSYLMAATSPIIGVAADFYGGGVPVGDGGPSPLSLTANIRCPVIIFDGDQDTRPSPEEVMNTAAELEKHGVIHEVHIYPGVNHAYMSAEGSARDESAIEDSWTRLFAWFHQYLPAAELAAAR